MAKFWNWLEGDSRQLRPLTSMAGVIFCALVLNVIWALPIIEWLYSTNFITPFDYSSANKSKVLWDFLLGAPGDETIFRWSFAVFSIAILEVDKMDQQRARKYWLGTVLIGSAIFGVAHGALFYLILHGVNGLFLWIVYLYCSRLGKDIYIGLAASSITHFLYNVFIKHEFFFS